MKKILFLVGDALGHVGRSLVVARALQGASGVQVEFAALSTTHAQTLIAPEFPLRLLSAGMSKGLCDVDFAALLENVISDAGPDLIVLDLSPIPWLTQARLPDIPQVYLTNFFLTHLGRMQSVQDQWFEVERVAMNNVRRRRGLSEILHARDLYERDVVVLCDPEEMIPSTADMPGHYVCAGPCVWEPSREEPEITREHKSFLKEGLLYVSMGSTGDRPLPGAVVEALAQVADVNTCVWAGEVSAPSCQTGHGLNTIAFRQLPASKVLSKARLALVQGGAGSTYQALCQGVPVAVWPAHRNHEILGRYVERMNLGVMLSQDWRKDVSRLQNTWPAIQEKASVFKSGCRAGEAPERAARAILTALAEGAG